MSNKRKYSEVTITDVASPSTDLEITAKKKKIIGTNKNNPKKENR